MFAERALDADFDVVEIDEHRDVDAFLLGKPDPRMENETLSGNRMLQAETSRATATGGRARSDLRSVELRAYR